MQNQFNTENAGSSLHRLVLVQGMDVQNRSVGGEWNAGQPYTYLTAWKTWMLAQSLSWRTVNERLGTVIRMAEQCRVSPHLAGVEHIVGWLAENGAWTPRTRHTYHSALTAWFLWLQKQEIRPDNPMVHVGKPKSVRSDPRPISDRDLVRVLAIRKNRRTTAMLLLAAFAGLRVHEIAKVRGEHLDLISRHIRVVGKGGHTDTLPLHHRIIECAYQMPKTGWWFPGVDGGHQRRESVGGTIKEAMTRAGVVGSAHQLRHWYGTALVEAGVDLRTVQELMRHRQLTSTQIYTKVSDQRRADGVNRLDPWSWQDNTRTLHSA